MKRFGHAFLALTLLVVATCATLRADAHTHQNQKTSTCPLHSQQSQDSVPSSGTCANCLSSHFVSESKVHFEGATVGAPSALFSFDPSLLSSITALPETLTSAVTVGLSPPVLRI
jgi:hypothetical protein